ncbi:unnamed protein product [Thelazia callipaeda]|uniref:SMP-LTD domain-containing protein n=1 Tax=Thelazia callipaeda TaxID=103827 RepID=A0A0N5CJX6_THECL|nr:unnamed protein product [Thelazia callipaeda]
MNQGTLSFQDSVDYISHFDQEEKVVKECQIFQPSKANEVEHEAFNARSSDNSTLSLKKFSPPSEEMSHSNAVSSEVKNKNHNLVDLHKEHEDSEKENSVRKTNQVFSSEEKEKMTSFPVNQTLLSQPSIFFDWFTGSNATVVKKDKAIQFQYPWILQFLIRSVSGFFSGFLWGLYISFIWFIYFFISEPVKNDFSVSKDIILNITEDLKEHKDSNHEIYKGWMNEFRGKYHPSTYHVNASQTVLVCLDGNLLRVSRLQRTVLKHAFHTDPTLAQVKPTISSQSIYNLTGAMVTLRPKRLARRRWWSRKYPIHIRLASSSNEISTLSPFRKSFSVNEAVDISNSASASSDDEFSNIHVMRGIMKGSPELRKVLHKSKMESGSQKNFKEHSHYICVKSARANSMGCMQYRNQCDTKNENRIKGQSLYLFVRSAREKERWFHKLREASSQYIENAANVMVSTVNSKESLSRRRLSLPLSSDENLIKLNLEHFLYLSNRIQFEKCIKEVIKTSLQKKTKETSGAVKYMDLGRNKWSRGKADTDSELVMSANALAARIFYDFCRDAYWCKQVQNKIQSKLATVHLPYFIETLELSSLDLGTTSPEIAGVYAPVLDDWGLWIDFEMKYSGRIHLSLETKVNLMKLKEGTQRNELCREAKKLKIFPRVHHYSDSDLPESPESSPDEDFGSKTEKVSTNKGSAGRKLLNVVDKIVNTNIFQGASELKPVKKVMEGISSTRLLLNVDVIHLEGTMTINIPPPPSDRLWYAFRTPPRLFMKCVPQVGDRSVDMSAVSNWIDNKLRLLLEKNLVLPNMDDLIVPVMSGNELLKSGYNC